MKPKTTGYAIITSLWVSVAALATYSLYREWREWEHFKSAIPVALQVMEDAINQYDPLLGWKHIPNKYTQNVLPNGVPVAINSFGFRASQEYTFEKPDSITRIIAVGDSFTFGLVEEKQTWPSQTELLAKNLQVINMGACAYGVDQMYLWYKSDGIKFAADLVIFAVILDDLERVHSYKWLSGHGKPKFILRNGALELTNVPVPHRVEPGHKNTHWFDVLTFLRGRWGSVVTYSNDLELGFEILRVARDLVKSQGSEFLLLILPQWVDVERDRDEREKLLTFASEARMPVLDLTNLFRAQLEHDQISKAFLPDAHYNAFGNTLVATGLIEYLTAAGLVAK